MDDPSIKLPPPPPPATYNPDQWKPLQEIQNEPYTHPRARFCEKLAYDPRTLAKKRTCGDDHCKYAHTFDQLTAPPGYNNGVKVGKGTVRFLDWGTPFCPAKGFECALSLIKPSKYTKFITERPNRKLPLPRLCYAFLFHGKCPYWANCLFVHLEASQFRELARTCYCGFGRRPPDCPYLAVCPYAHDASKIKVPDEFKRVMNSPGIGKPLNVRYTASDGKTTTEQVDGRYIASRADANVLNTTLCTTAFCDFSCNRIHLLAGYWVDKPKAVFPIHDYLLEQGLVKLSAPVPVKNVWAERKAAAVANSPKEEHPVDEHAATVVGAAPTTSLAPTAATAPPSVRAALLHDMYMTTQENGSYREALETMLTIKDTKLQFTPDSVPNKPCEQACNRWASRSRRYQGSYKQLIEARNQFMCAGDRDQFLYHESLLLGTGGSSQVFLGLLADDGSEIALKILLSRGTHDRSRETSELFQQEIAALKERNSVPGVVRYVNSSEHWYDVTRNGRASKEVTRSIALELMECSLEEVVHKWQQQGLLGTQFHFLACQYIFGSLIDTLCDLRKRSTTNTWVIHRDIKPGNIQFDILLQPRLIDFGIAKMLLWEDDSRTTKSNFHTIGYSPPEAPHFEATSDLYSAGVLLGYMLTGRTLGPDAIAGSVHLEWPHKQFAALHLLKNLLVSDPQQRAFWQYAGGRQDYKKVACCKILLTHPFFWDDRKAYNFLVALGDVSSSHVAAEVRDTIKHAVDNSKPWYRQIDQNFWDERQAIKEHKLADPDDRISLLRFVRNCTHHPHNSALLRDSPYFLERFPRLVVLLWEKAIMNDALRELPTLRSFLHVAYIPTMDIALDRPHTWF